MGYESIIYEKEENIAKLTFNRPEKLNAFTWDMLDEIVDALRDAKKDDSVEVLIITGKDRGFSSGMDVSQVRDVMSDKLMPTAVIVSELKTYEKPSIAMVNGPAVGAGVDVALFCDFAVASENAFFWYSYIKRGAIPSVGCWIVPRIIGVKGAMRMLMLADKIEAAEAERLGLVYKVVPQSELEAATMDLAKRLTGLPPVAYRFTKHSINRGLTMDLDTSIEFAAYARAVAARHKEADEGVSAYFEKREAKF
jgi:2-(1,2-epoxy-1,2-dihydrophenyl)acetyl-CoA isomerase